MAATYLKTSNRTLGEFIPTPGAGPRGDAPQAPTLRHALGYKGHAAVAQGEAFDPSPANIEARTRSARSCPAG